MKKIDWTFKDIFSENWMSHSSIYLLAIFSGLFAIHVNLLSRANDGSLMGSSLLYWIAAGSTLWPKRENLFFESGFLGSLVGILILSLVLLKSTFMQGYDPFLRIAPFLSGLGLGLIASGFRGLKQYWKELAILAFLIPPPSALSLLVDTSVATAKFSTILLWYCGFDVIRQDSFILIPNGGVEVYSGCSGIDTMLHLLGLSVIFLTKFSTSQVQQFILPIVALMTAFVVNGLRVGIMAILSAPNNKVAFEYWHKGDGSLLFSLLSVVLLGTYCFFVIKQDEIDNEEYELLE